MLRRPRLDSTSSGDTELVRLGSFGILHPEVLMHYETGEYPASAVELDLQPLI